jgi:phosphatidylglycerol:prolipoprotein diacylglycerol transferase
LEATHVLVGWGGIAGGMAALAAITIKWGENFLAIADICTPGYLVGIGIGRIGCHFAGCCFGIHTTSSCGVTFSDPNAIASAMQQPLIPSQLISSVFLIMSGIAFVPFVLRKKTAGICFASSAMLYSLFRFVVEFIRNDPRKFLFGFSDGQIFSAAYFALGAWILLYVIKKRRRTSV